MSFDVAALRAQFPILATAPAGRPLHYLDNAATSQLPQAVLDAVARHETTRRANVLRGVHRLAEEATEAFEDARAKVATFVNAASPREIVFGGGTTGAINLVAHSLGAGLDAGDEIVLSVLEHHSNLVPWQLLRDRAGVVLKFLSVTGDGRIDVARLDDLVSPRCKLIALSHCSNVTGAIMDVAPMVEAARRVGARVLLDGAQRVPHGAVDVQQLGVDFYAFSGHKMFAPNGIGVLWGRFELLDRLPPFMGGGEMIRAVTIDKTIFADIPHRFEAGTPPIAQAVGLGAAVDWMGTLNGEAVTAHQHRLTARLLDGLTSISRSRGGVLRIIGPQGLQNRIGVVSFTIAGAHPHDVCQILDGHGVAVRGGHHCAQPLMDYLEIDGTTRASLAPYNDDADIDALLDGVEEAIDRLL